MRKYTYIIYLFLAVAATAISTEVAAQKLSIGYIYPAGGSQGSSVDIKVGGLNIKDATSAVISGDGIRSEIIPIPEPEPEYFIGKDGKRRKKFVPKNKLTDQSAPQIADVVGIRVHIDKDAELGLRNLRIQSKRGVSNQLSFEVSSYPNLLESQSDDVVTNQVESLPATLCGFVKAGQVDRFTFHAEKGMNLVAEVKGRILVPYIADAVPGWFQAVVKLTNSRGQEVAYADDYRTSPDPVLRFVVPESGDYTLAIHDAIFRGREDFNYRIQIGEIPFVESIHPIVARLDARTTMEVSGRNLATQKVAVKPTEAGLNYLRVAGVDGKLSNQVPYWVVAKGETLITNPTAESRVTEDALIYDKISSRYEQREYKVELSAGESVVLDAISRRIDSRADLKMTLLSEDGSVVAENDDLEDTEQGLMTHHADPVINVKVKESGLYRLVVEDIQGGSGSEYSYLLRRRKPSAPFEAFVSPANITLSQGGTTTFNVSFNFKGKRDKTTKGIGRIELTGLPAGYRVSNAVPGRFPRQWALSVSSPESAKIGTFPIGVNVYSFPTRGEKDMVVEARATDQMMQAFYYNHYIPAADFTAEVIEAIPYSVHFAPEIERDLEKPILFNRADTTVAVKIVVKRQEGFDDELELALGTVSKLFTLDPVTILPNETEKTIHIKIDKEKVSKMKFLKYQLFVTATVQGDIRKQGQRTFVNALYKDMTPIVMLQPDDMPNFNPYKTPHGGAARK